MNKDQQDWLFNLSYAVPIEARKNNTSMYTIALEGWRRGLKLKFYNVKNGGKQQTGYALSYRGKEHYFNGSGGDLITDDAYAICEDKNSTNLYLTKAGVPIPESKKFTSENTNEAIVNYAKSIKFPVVLKPTNASSGKGVVSDIKNEQELKKALYYVRNTLCFEDVLIQRYISGDEVRVYVLRDKVLGAVKRIPANIVGDGINSIKKLIEKKNLDRKNIPHLYFRPIKLDNEMQETIESEGYTLDSVLKKDKRLYLKKISNISVGGEPIDVTNELSSENKDIAIQATKAISGLTHAGVDMIIDEKNDTAVILELNTKPGLGSHLFPVEGTGKNIPKHIIDFYFPETRDNSVNCINSYFNFGDVLDFLKGTSISEIELILQRQSGEVGHAKKYTITGNIKTIDYHRIRRKALEQRLHGHIKKIDDNNLEIVMASTKELERNEFERMLNQGSHRTNNLKIIEDKWNYPIKLGFEIYDGLQEMSVRELGSQLQQKEKEIKLIEKEQRRLQHRINMIQQSRTWRYTSFVRSFIKRIKRTKAK